MYDDEYEWDHGDPDYDEEDYGDESDLDQFPCPECGAPVFEDLDVCPKCGYFILDDDRQSTPFQPASWSQVLGFLGIVATMIILSGLLHLL